MFLAFWDLASQDTVKLSDQALCNDNIQSYLKFYLPHTCFLLAHIASFVEVDVVALACFYSGNLLKHVQVHCRCSK